MQEQLKIRQGILADVDTLVRFNLQMAKETEDIRLLPEVLAAGVESVLRNPALGFYLVAEIRGKIVGSLMVTTEWSDWRNGTFWWIQSVYVAPKSRRRGIFRALYNEVRERAKKSAKVCGCRLYVERDNAVAQATYASLGMTETKYKLLEEQFR
ncbi:MAG TPA: GNAT family N-acetyltransferase [Desulfonatronum sp.]|nr:GNAT family N-acetyltransferase [Desulfonatronum sp.]